MASSARSATLGVAQPTCAAQVRLNLMGRYFSQWASLTLQRIFKEQLEEKIAYIDLCADYGDAPVADGVSSHILPWANRHRNLSQQLFTLLHTTKEEALEPLKTQLQAPDQIDRLAFEPQFSSGALSAALQKSIETVRALPTLLIADFGQDERVTWDWLYELVQRHGADVLLTIDVQWVIKHLHRNKQRPILERLLGIEGLEQLIQQGKQQRLSYAQKVAACQQLVNQQISELLNDTPTGGALCFTFCDAQDRPAQWLLFLSTQDEAYTLMRAIMVEESQLLVDGIGNLQYLPGQPTKQRIQSPTLFGPLFDLAQELRATYLNQTIQLIDLYQAHHKGRSYIRQNYHDALLQLEEQGAIKITRERPGRGRQFPKSHLTDKAFVSFKAVK